MNPTRDKSILNPNWKYVPAARQSIKATFARVRKEMKDEAARSGNVMPLRREKK